MEKVYRWEKVMNGDPRTNAYKWEFLRRNVEFQREYKAFTTRFPEWIGKYGELISPAPSGFPDDVAAAVHNITELWWVMDPVCPSSAASQLPPNLDPPTFHSPREVESGAVWAVTQRSAHGGQSSFKPEDLRYQVFQIDIAQPLDVVFAELEFYMTMAKSAYESHVGPLPVFAKRRRARLEEYGSYLRVWDLRMQGRLTFEQIAFRLFPREMKNEDVREAMIKRVRTQFQRSKRLIEGEYRQIGG